MLVVVSLDLYVGLNFIVLDFGFSIGGGFVWVFFMGLNNFYLICDVLIYFFVVLMMCYLVLWVVECLDCVV